MIKANIKSKFAVPSKLDGHHKLPIPQFVDGNCVKIVLSCIHTFLHIDVVCLKQI